MPFWWAVCYAICYYYINAHLFVQLVALKYHRKDVVLLVIIQNIIQTLKCILTTRTYGRNRAGFIS